MPEHTTDFRNYLWQFKDVLNSRGESYYDLIKSQGLRFVHQVQHWLQDEEYGKCLQIEYSVRANTQEVLDNGLLMIPVLNLCISHISTVSCILLQEWVGKRV